MGPGGGKPYSWSAYIYDSSPYGTVTYYSKDRIDWAMDYYYGTEHVQVSGTGLLP